MPREDKYLVELLAGVAETDCIFATARSWQDCCSSTRKVAMWTTVAPLPCKNRWTAVQYRLGEGIRCHRFDLRVYCRYIVVSICGVTNRKHEIPPPLSTPDSRLTQAKPFFHRLLLFPPDTVPPPRPLLYCAPSRCTTAVREQRGPSQREGEAEAHHVVDGAAASAASAAVGSPVCATSMHPTSGLLDRGRVDLGRVDVCGKCGTKRVGESERSS